MPLEAHFWPPRSEVQFAFKTMRYVHAQFQSTLTTFRHAIKSTNRVVQLITLRLIKAYLLHFVHNPKHHKSADIGSEELKVHA